MNQYQPSLARLRHNRTLESNRVRRMIHHLITDTATRTGPDGLPSWWPFWSDSLVQQVRTCVRAARALAKAEGIDLE